MSILFSIFASVTVISILGYLIVFLWKNKDTILEKKERPPRVVVLCPAINCSFNVNRYCTGTPWIDMKIDGHTVTCLDYVDERELNGN
jgi:hypothetical protein